MLIKICGLTEKKDVRTAAKAGADIVGFIFARSQRQVRVAEAAALRRTVPSGLNTAGVFVNAPLEEVRSVMKRCRLDYAQLHGSEDMEYCRAIGAKKVIKAIRVKEAKDLARANAYRETAFILLDTYVVGRRGGSGRTFDWSLARRLTQRGMRVILAGGLTPDSVGEAIRLVRPAGVDVSTGVEMFAGVKDPEKIQAFVKAARAESFRHLPDDRGHFGLFGGSFIPETLVPALEELKASYGKARRDPAFLAAMDTCLREYAGRPTPLYPAKQFAKACGVAKVYLKREDLCHTGAHKINNTVGQVLLAKRMKKKRIIAETGAGQHGVATATAAALLGLECHVYMGEEDIRRQSLNVFRMKLLGTEVIPVASGSRTLKDAINEALRDWVTNVRTTHYVIGSCVGPDPYPRMVRDFQSIIGREARAQILEAEGKLPDVCVACVGGGSNSIGLFHAFLEDPVEIVGVEAAGEGLASGRHAASLMQGRPGVLHGSNSYLLQTADGQITPTHSISAGLDYPGVGPEHAYLKDKERVRYEAVTDEEALEAFHALSRREGILPALEPAHALAYVLRKEKRRSKRSVFLVGLSGRGDKDVHTVAETMGVTL